MGRQQHPGNNTQRQPGFVRLKPGDRLRSELHGHDNEHSIHQDEALKVQELKVKEQAP